MAARLTALVGAALGCALAATNDVAEVAEVPRAEGYSREFQMTMKPVGRLVTSLRRRLSEEAGEDTVRRLLAVQGARLSKVVVYAGVIDRFGKIRIGSLPEHPDYGAEFIVREDQSLHPMKAAYVMRRSRSETWMIHRRGTPHQFELLVQPNLEGKYDKNLIYYCIDLEAICAKARRNYPLRPGEATYLVSRGGHLITQSIDEDQVVMSRLTVAEQEYLNSVEQMFVARTEGVHSFVGFSREGAELVVYRFTWRKLARSANDDWILVFEERLPPAKREDRPLFGTWLSQDQAAPLRLGILQEGNKLYFRADGITGPFRAEGRFVKNRIGVTSFFQSGGDTELINFSADFDGGKDQVVAQVLWKEKGKARSREVTLRRATEPEDMAPVRVPLGFTPFPDAAEAPPGEAKE